MSAPLVFLNTETTGLHPDRRAWEISMIRAEGPELGAKLKGCTIIVSDVDISQAEPKALAMNGFYERHPLFIEPQTSAPSTQPRDTWLFTEQTAAAKIERWTRGATIVGANPSFDTITLDAMLRRHKLVPSWHHRMVDVESLTAGKLGTLGDDGRLLGLGRCAEALGLDVDPQLAHTALGDVKLAHAVYRSVIA